MRDLARNIIHALPMPVILVGPDERIAATNAAAARLVATGAEGRHYITALRQPAMLDCVEQTLRDGRHRTTRYLGAEGGRDTSWHVTAAGVVFPEGQGVLLTFEDVTAVEEAGQMRRDFVANVSHELRTPLTALLGFVETLKGAARDDPVARDRFLGIMEREAGRMAQLVNDLLSLSRVEQEERVRPMTPVDLNPLVESVVAAFEPMAAQGGNRLNVVLPSDPVQVPGDAEQLRQVLANLIENALKYGRPGGQVDVTLSSPAMEPVLRNAGVRLTVADEGDGIAPHHIPRLTERFYRVDSHRSREVGGTGLGLAIVKHIVNRHRGRLRIESEPGKGSRFTVILPLT
jgi:two-component system phosphate regulon sensor histidine kinase PhoR